MKKEEIVKEIEERSKQVQESLKELAEGTINFESILTTHALMESFENKVQLMKHSIMKLMVMNLKERNK